MTIRRDSVAVLLTLFLAVSVTGAQETRRELDAAVEGNNAFALDLYSVLKAEKGNLFLSPYSITSALAMTYGGARGDTAKEMAKALHFTLGADGTHPAFAELHALLEKIQEKGKVQLHVANSLWPQEGRDLKAEYLNLIKQHYDASITPVDYANAAEEACKTINAWVEERTKDNIKDLIRPGDLPPLTVLTLVNAIYFKGNWAKQFDPKDTTKSDFTLADGTKTQVSMMYQKGNFRYRQIEGAQLLELPYIGEELSMMFILPDKPDGLSRIETQFTAKNMDAWMSRLSRKTVKVYLPRFKVTWGAFELNKALHALGMRKAFESNADFSGMDQTGDLFIGPVLHKAFVEVNEEGTEATAATAVQMPRNGGKTYTFRAAHPFLFLIRENVRGTILFLGRLLEPPKQKGSGNVAPGSTRE